ncbi:hypothetical protein NE237_028344 [Protea cynaroides]|uniref:Uncharacterized protein n=1 Tax=Protea cynaroides TaxID=273540 RepID=A0A9Q0JTZ2_9MAGN|nr:hypothetical protein NE237_028344 [Protea cynaroides]
MVMRHLTAENALGPAPNDVHGQTAVVQRILMNPASKRGVGSGPDSEVPFWMESSFWKLYRFQCICADVICFCKNYSDGKCQKILGSGDANDDSKEMVLQDRNTRVDQAPKSHHAMVH